MHSFLRFVGPLLTLSTLIGALPQTNTDPYAALTSCPVGIFGLNATGDSPVSDEPSTYNYQVRPSGSSFWLQDAKDTLSTALDKIRSEKNVLDEVPGGKWDFSYERKTIIVRKVPGSSDKLIWGNVKLALRHLQRYYDQATGRLVRGAKCAISDMTYLVAVVRIGIEDLSGQDLCADDASVDDPTAGGDEVTEF